MIEKKHFVSANEKDNILLSVYFRIDEDTDKVHAFKSIIPADMSEPYTFSICCEYEIFDIDDDLTDRLSIWGTEAIETALP